MPRYIVKDYYGCTRCPLHQFRRNIVFGRGSIPADIMFTGEGAGKSEDLLGIPFVGPSGRLLEKAIERAATLSGVPTPSYFITNIVACRPTDSFKGENRPPNAEEAYACFNRLQKTYFDVSPKVIVTLGDVPKKYIAKTWPGAVNLPHPAAILRAGGIESPMFRRFARDLSEVFRSITADRTP